MEQLRLTKASLWWWLSRTVAAIIAFVPCTASGDVTIGKDEVALRVWISGTITKKDAESIERRETEIALNNIEVHLNSFGGNVAAAMRIGRLVRKYDGTTRILKAEKCLSSCALIFIAGVQRYNYGEIGLHRPFLATAPQSRSLIEKQVPMMLSQIKAYVAEMGITDGFYEQMVNTEPSSMAKYDSSNYERLIPRNDPVHDEIMVSARARRLGTSTHEMRKRDIEADNKCRYGEIGQRAYDVCMPAIEWGLSEQVFLDRKSKADEACEISNKDSDILGQIPRKQRMDHPILSKKFACQRQIMLGRD